MFQVLPRHTLLSTHCIATSNLVAENNDQFAVAVACGLLVWRRPPERVIPAPWHPGLQWGDWTLGWPQHSGWGWELHRQDGFLINLLAACQGEREVWSQLRLSTIVPMCVLSDMAAPRKPRGELPGLFLPPPPPQKSHQVISKFQVSHRLAQAQEEGMRPCFLLREWQVHIEGHVGRRTLWWSSWGLNVKEKLQSLWCCDSMMPDFWFLMWVNPMSVIWKISM